MINISSEDSDSDNEIGILSVNPGKEKGLNTSEFMLWLPPYAC